jgi:hypothetical protein
MKTLLVLLVLRSSAYALEPVVKSGTRLQARIAATTYAGPDGSSIKMRGRYYIFDTAIGHACEIWPSGSGATCEPTDDLISFSPSEYSFAFSDPACKMPVLVAGNPAIASKVRFFRYADPRVYTDPGTIYRVGSPVRLSSAYAIHGSCVLVPGSVDALSLTAMPTGPALISSTSTEVLP